MKPKTPEEIILHTLGLKTILGKYGVYNEVVDCLQSYSDQQNALLIEEVKLTRNIAGWQKLLLTEKNTAVQIEIYKKRLEEAENALHTFLNNKDGK